MISSVALVRHITSRYKRWLALFVCSFFAVIGYWLWVTAVTPLTVTIELYADRPDRMEVFWSNDSDQFFADKQQTRSIMPNRQTTYTFNITSDQAVDFIRIDPMARPGKVWIRKVGFETRWGDYQLGPQEIPHTKKSIHQAQLKLSPESNDLAFFGLAHDPYVVLPVPLALYNYNPVRAVANSAAVFFGSIVIGTFFLIILPAAFRHKWMLRLSEIFIENAKVSVLGAALLVLIPLAFYQGHLARITPIFQGPDEIAHVANSMHGFANWFGEPYQCGDLWPPIKESDDWVREIRNNPYQLMTSERIEGLETVFDRTSWSQLEKRPSESFKYSTCATSNLVSKLIYNIVSIPYFLVNPDSHAGHYLLTLRYGQILTGTVLWFLVFFVIAHGQCLFSNLMKININRARLVITLAALAYLLIPQQIFLTSVTSREAYLVPLGVLVSVSFVFRYKLVTVIGAIFFIALIFERRPSYILPVFLLGLWYLTLYMRSKWEMRQAIYLPAIFFLIVYLGLPVLLHLVQAIAPILGIRMPGEIVAFERMFLPWKQVLDSMWSAYSLTILSGGSFVGVLGSMDTPLPWPVFQRVQLPFVILIVTFLLWVVGSFSKRKINIDTVGILTLFFVAMPIALGIVAYSVYEVYSSSFDGHRPWGHGVQGRYFLPLYFPVFLTWYLAGFVFWLSPLRQGIGQKAFRLLHDRRVFVVTILLVWLVLVWVAISNQIVIQRTLVWRYFGDEALLADYLRLFY